MRAAVPHDLLPPPRSSPSNNRKGEFLFSVVLLLLALVLLGLGRAYVPGPLHRWFAPLPFQSPADVLLLALAALAAMLLHEVGHLLAAVVLGFDLLGGTLGPLQLQILHGSWKVTLSPRTFFTASVSAVPGGFKDWRVGMLMVVAAGPVATLGAMLSAASLSGGDQLCVFTQLAFVQVSVLLLVLGLIPTRPNARIHNDARLLWDLARRNRGAEEIELHVRLTQQVVAGVRPQDYPEALLERLAAWQGRPESRLAFAQALVRWALDSEEIALADAWDLRALSLAEECGSRLQNGALASSACFDVIFRDDPESARNKFERVKLNELFPRCFEQRARAAQQLALGRRHRVGALVIRAQYAIPRGIPAYALERRLLAKLHRQVLLAGERADGIKYRSAAI